MWVIVFLNYMIVDEFDIVDWIDGDFYQFGKSGWMGYVVVVEKLKLVVIIFDCLLYFVMKFFCFIFIVS